MKGGKQKYTYDENNDFHIFNDQEIYGSHYNGTY